MDKFLGHLIIGDNGKYVCLLLIDDVMKANLGQKDKELETERNIQSGSYES